jgi:DNA-binding CsgD family transcriptional regulator
MSKSMTSKRRTSTCKRSNRYRSGSQPIVDLGPLSPTGGDRRQAPSRAANSSVGSVSLSSRTEQLVDFGSQRPESLAQSSSDRGYANSYKLTRREGEIARLLLADNSCKEAAATLGLTVRVIEHTVEHLKLRFSKSTLHGLIGYLAILNLGIF